MMALLLLALFAAFVVADGKNPKKILTVGDSFAEFSGGTFGAYCEGGQGRRGGGLAEQRCIPSTGVLTAVSNRRRSDRRHADQPGRRRYNGDGLDRRRWEHQLCRCDCRGFEICPALPFFV